MKKYPTLRKTKLAELYVVATPIGNLADLSERAVEILKSADLIACEDTRTSSVLLSHIGARGKTVSNHKFNEKEKAAYIAERIKNENLTAAIVTDAGTPCISDPGYELIKEARNSGIKIIGIPGACAATVAVSISGLKVSSWTFVGFLPKKKGEFDAELEKIALSDVNTFVIYETPIRIIDTIKALYEKFGNCELFVANDLTKKFERHYTGTTREIINELVVNEKSGKGEYVVVMNKNADVKRVEDEISAEARIFDRVIKGVTIKDAVNELSKKFPKNDLYKAGLKVKDLIK